MAHQKCNYDPDQYARKFVFCVSPIVLSRRRNVHGLKLSPTCLSSMIGKTPYCDRNFFVIMLTSMATILKNYDTYTYGQIYL